LARIRALRTITADKQEVVMASKASSTADKIIVDRTKPHQEREVARAVRRAAEVVSESVMSLHLSRSGTGRPSSEQEHARYAGPQHCVRRQYRVTQKHSRGIATVAADYY
jgi:hypothetical protein